MVARRVGPAPAESPGDGGSGRSERLGGVHGSLDAGPGRPKAVVFDLGKVLLELFGHAPAGSATGLLAPWGGVSLVEQLERGQLSNREFYEAVTEASGLRVDFPTFAELYADIFAEEPAMIAQQQRLLRAGVPCFLMSNCSGLHIDDVRRRYPFFNSFSGLILSYEVHSFKPDPEIYAAAEQLAQGSGPDLLFIDDRQENAAAAAQRGWQAIHHKSPAETLLQMRQLGLPSVDI
ncbi:hypothetical protein ABPG75_013453 [Micractinium tetrahymenae]